MHLTSIYAISYQSIFKIISVIVNSILDLSSFLLQGRFSRNPRKVTYYAILRRKIEIKVTVAIYPVSM